MLHELVVVEYKTSPLHGPNIQCNSIFTMWVIVVSVQGRQSFRILEDILSIPGALLDGSLLITFSTWLSVTWWSSNKSGLTLEDICKGVGTSRFTLSPWCKAKSLAFWAVVLPTEVKKSFNLLANPVRSSEAIEVSWCLRGRHQLMIFQNELEFPLLFRIWVLTWTFSAIWISLFTSWRKNLYLFQWRGSFVFPASLRHWSRVLISWRISSVMKGLDLILTLLISWLSTSRSNSLNTSTWIKYHSIQIHSSSLIVFSDGDGNDDEQLESTTNISSWFPSKRDSSSSGKRKSVTTWGHAMLQICPTSAILFTFSISCCPRETHMWIAQTGHDTFHFRQQEVVPYGQSVLTNGKRPKKNHNFLCAFMRVGLSDHEIWPHFCDFSGSQVVGSFS